MLIWSLIYEKKKLWNVRSPLLVKREEYQRKLCTIDFSKCYAVSTTLTKNICDRFEQKQRDGWV